MPLKILLNGAKGRMGRVVAEVAGRHDAVVAAAVDLGDDPASAIGRCDVVLDFSQREVTLSIVKLAAGKKKPVIIGTTGHTPEERKAVAAFAAQIPLVWTGNFSIGVNLLFFLTAKAAAILDKSYQPEIVEMHHRHKKDAPSGTAARLAEIIRAARKLSNDQVKYGRKGITGERPDEEIGVHSLRGGDVVGEHTVYFAGQGERLEFTHKAADRRIFAQGALQAAHWLVRQKPGLYDMEDVLGLKNI
jgi:4-hydroxy-tetrahydrodipicolinate reductase